ncbi:MAG: hypothetical protein QNL05_12015 [Gammaproteobacteria bacterium]|nr:hypothetical protein [Gammaproteobacteria bacterium]
MATIFDRISVGLNSSQLTEDLGAQAKVLTDFSDRLQDLKQAPQFLSNLGQTLNELPLSDFNISASFSANFTSLGQAIPTDISSVTGPLEQGIQDLTNTLDEDLTQVIDGLIKTIAAISSLMEMDFLCANAGQTQDSASDSSSGSDSSDSDSSSDTDSDATPTTPAITQSTQQIQQLKNILDLLPEPFDVSSLLDLIALVGQQRHASSAIPDNIPMLDDIIDTADTLSRWKLASDVELRDELVQSVRQLNTFIESTLTARLSAISSAVASVLPTLDTTSLANIADTIRTEVNSIAEAVRNDTIIAVNLTPFNTALDDYNVLLSTLSPENKVNIDQVCHQIEQLPAILDDEMAHLEGILRPNLPVGDFCNLIQAISEKTIPSNSSIEESFQPLKDWLESLMETLDIESISAPLQEVSDTAQTAITGLEQNLSQVTVEIRSLLSEFEQLLDQFDVNAIKTEIEQAINQLGAELTSLIDSIIEPIKDAVQEAISVLSDQLDQFSAEDIETAVNNAIQELTDIFEDPEVKEPLEEISNSLKKIEQQITEASFSPITDTVVAGLDDISESLKSIDTADLNDMIKSALAAALKVVPDSLEPVTDPLLDEFDELIDKGPVPVLNAAKAQPERLFELLHSFKPASLLEEPLGKPFNSLLSDMENYRPSQLLQPLQSEIDGVKQRLKDSADPARALEQLSGPYNSLLQQFDQLQPSQLIEPLNKILKDAIEELLTAVPVEEVLNTFDTVLEPFQEIGNLSDSLTDLADRIDAIGSALESPETQIETWLENTLNKLDTLPDLVPLQQEFNQLTSNLDNLSASSLQTAFTSHTTSLSDMLNTMEPGARLNNLLSAYAEFPAQALQALPDSPEKEAIETALGRFNPLESSQNVPYRLLANCQQTLAGSQTQLTEQLANWDSRYLGQDSLFNSFRIDNVDAAALRQWLGDELSRSFISLFKAFLERFAQFIKPIADLLKQLVGLSVPITERLDALLLGPGSLQGIQDAFNDLVAALQGFNLDFLTEAVDDIFQQIKSKLDIINPETLAEPLSQQFDNILNTLDFANLIPQAEQDLMDQSYLTLLETLRALSPVELAERTIQPSYEEKILPIIESFDFTSLLATLIERLQNLAEELKVELQRVNQSFANMKNSVPV